MLQHCGEVTCGDQTGEHWHRRHIANPANHRLPVVAVRVLSPTCATVFRCSGDWLGA